MVQLVRPELEAPLARISRRVTTLVAGLSQPDASSLWAEAVRAILALHQAPQHYLRSQLVLLGSVAAGGALEGEPIERFAAGIELLHLFMLVHDDVLDDSHRRRGQPTLHVALQRAAPTLGGAPARHMAIIAGNTLCMLGVREITGADRACQLVLDACLRTGMGQFEDIVGWYPLSQPTLERCRELLEYKSAYQSFAAPFAGGFLFADSKADPAAALAWARRMGVALQGIDDLGDFVGDPAKTGKDNFRDVLEGRVSLVVLLLLQRAKAEERQFLIGLLGAGALDPVDRLELSHLLVRHDILERCRAFIEAEITEAERVGDGFSRARDSLAAIAEDLRAKLHALLAEAHQQLQSIHDD